MDTPTTYPRNILIPIQVIMESPSITTTVQRDPKNIQDSETAPSPTAQTETQMTPQGAVPTSANVMGSRNPFTSEEATVPADGSQPIIFCLENQKANAAWGDVLNEKPPAITRVYGMNVNGLSLDQRGGQLDVLCKVM